MAIAVALFNAQLNDAEKILREVDLLDGWRNFWHNPVGLAAQLRGRSYGEVWEYLYRNQLFDFRLRDYALLQFRRSEDGELVGYAYYDAPFNVPSYEDFVARELELTAEEVGEEYREEYEEYLQGVPRRDSVTPIRYDYDPTAYRAGVHPASHVHLGAGNEIRICTQKIFLPLSFTLMVIRQCYPTEWIRLLAADEAKAWCRNVRENLDDVGAEFFQELDGHEHALL